MVDMKRKVVLTGCLLLGLLLIPVLGHAQLFSEQAFKLNRVLNLISNYYVDTVSEGELVETAIVRMLEELDPHSVYVPLDEVREMNDPLVGNFEGIGIQFNILYDTILIISPISGGPSEKVGMRAGDRIVKIEDENVAGVGITTKQVQDRLMGEKGTRVKVTVLRRGVSNPLDFVITRDKIPIYSLDAAYLLNNETVYIKLNRFSITTEEEFSNAYNRLKSTEIKNLVLDLRGNGGGYLEVAVSLLDKIFASKRIVVYMEGIKSPRRDYYTSSEGELSGLNLAILIDEGSASASEIMAGAVQDYDRGIIIGRRSFGKGLVQRPFTLPDGSMIRLTVARYFTPTGRSIQKPYENGSESYIRELNERYSKGEYFSADKITFPDSLMFNTLVSGRVVYGGGGIMPDIFVPADTSGYTGYYRDLIQKGIFNRFILDYVDSHREELTRRFASFTDFRQNYTVDDAVIGMLVSYAERDGLASEPGQLQESRYEIATLIKALIARDIWDTSEYFEIVNEKDPVIMRAVEMLGNQKVYSELLLR